VSITVGPTNPAKLADQPAVYPDNKSPSQPIRGAVDTKSLRVQTAGVDHFGIALKVPLNVTFSPEGKRNIS
jgi:hypothetical protein